MRRYLESLPGGKIKKRDEWGGEEFGFGEAILRLKNGKRCTRKGWNGKNMYIELQTPDEHSKMSKPYIYIKTVEGDLVPWLASQADMLEEDWMEWA